MKFPSSFIFVSIFLLSVNASAFDSGTIYVNAGVALAWMSIIFYILKFVFIFLFLFKQPQERRQYAFLDSLKLLLPTNYGVRPEDKDAFKLFKLGINGLWFCVIFGYLSGLALKALEKNEASFKDFVTTHLGVPADKPQSQPALQEQ